MLNNNSIFIDQENEIPTLIAVENFDKVSDSKKLRSAVRGLGTDERPIIEILCNRSYEQRQKLIETYKKLYDRNLITDLRNDLGGHFRGKSNNLEIIINKLLFIFRF